MEVEIPTPKPNEVLVKVRATSVNASDWEFLTGSPAYTRAWGLFKPRFTILGSDIAGQVEAVGAQVSRFKQGDEVFGDVMGSWGGFAEYVCAPAKLLMFKPASLSFEEAAALPQSAAIAVQGVRDVGKVQPGQRVLINGGGGGSGTFAVQIAKHFGARVTGVDNATKAEIMRAIGADAVIDYAREDFTRSGEQYDLILDLVASHSIRDYRRALSPRGQYLMVGGSVPHLLQILILGPLLSMTRSRKMGLLAVKPNQGLDFAISLIEAGHIKPVINARYSLDQAAEALRHLGEGHARGKVVITI